MGKSRQPVLVTQKALILNSEGKLLALKDSTNKKWEFPGGHLEKGEQPEEGLKREVKEETGLEIKVETPVYSSAYENRHGNWTFGVVYLCLVEEEDVSISQEHEEWGWIKPEEFREKPAFQGYMEALEEGLEIREKIL